MVLRPRPIDNKPIIRSGYPEKSQELPDDIKYNEEWWKWYCQENKLDVNTGKSFDHSVYPYHPMF